MKEINQDITKDPQVVKNILSCFFTILIISTLLFISWESKSSIWEFTKIIYSYYHIIEKYILGISVVTTLTLCCALFKTDSKCHTTIRHLKNACILSSMIAIFTIYTVIMSIIVTTSTEPIRDFVGFSLPFFVFIGLAITFALNLDKN